MKENHNTLSTSLILSFGSKSKLCFLLIFLCLISFQSPSQNTFIPDDNFEQTLINLGLDSGPLDDFVLTSNISGELSLTIDNATISDLTGIEGFKALTQLYIQNNQLTTIDVSLNNNLQILWCFSNQLSSLDVTQNTLLISLRCEDNSLANLDTSNNPSLNVLICEQNQITALDVSNNTALNRFQCGNNLLSNLDITSNTNLSYLACEQNQLTDLNLLNNSRLAVLLCFNNQLTELNLSQNSSLTNLNCSTNLLCGLNIKNGNNNNVILMNFDSNPSLNCVVVDDSNGNHSIWEPSSFSNYANSTDACGNTIPVDSLNDFIGTSYVLPTLNNGNYFAESSGFGMSLSTGDVITTSQNIYIYNEINCYSNESSFTIIISNGNYFIPKYFTPNNDGRHDVWKVLDNSNSINNITIYNRYGKLIKFLAPNAQGWDGTFNGTLLTSDSYWYEIILNTGDVLRGAFALKR